MDAITACAPVTDRYGVAHERTLNVYLFRQWAELALLLVTHRLADSLAAPRPGEAGGGDSSSETTQLRGSASDMASRLRELDPSHRHFYDVLELGLATRTLGPPQQDDKT